MSRIVTLGEIMARLAAPGFKRFQQAMPGSLDVTFAGAEASVAASIAYLGGDAAFVTALPNHALADACVANLRAMGVQVSETADGLEIFGGTPLKGAHLSSFGDHRIAMAFAIAGMFAEGETVIDGVECVATSYPTFYETLQQITTEHQPQTPVLTALPPPHEK